MMSLNFHVVLKSRPGADGEPTEENFACEPCDMPSSVLKDGEVLIKSCYLSVDPALRCMMNDDPGVTYLAGWQIDKTIVALNGVGKVVASNNSNFSPGDLVQSVMEWPWKEYFVQHIKENDTNWQKVDQAMAGDPKLALHLVVGLTSVVGIWEKGHIRKDGNQTFVISGAAGGCGSVAGQVGRNEGCTNVVGICGTDDKCSWIVNDLGFTSAINYKTEAVSTRLDELCPKGIDVYFDNVGGGISDIVISKMNKDGHIILCGQISQYNKDVPYPPPLAEETNRILETRNITRDRFTLVNYPHRYQEAATYFVSSVLTGKIKVRETIAKGLSNTGNAFVSMMKGGNIGKQIVQLSDP